MPELKQETAKEYIERRIKELNNADAEFCSKRWAQDEMSIVRQLARESSNQVTFARQELQEVEKVLNKEKDYKALFQAIIPFVNELVYYSQIHTVEGVISGSGITHDQAWRKVRQFIWDNCNIVDHEYILK